MERVVSIYDVLAVVAVVVCGVMGTVLLTLATKLWIHHMVQDWRCRERFLRLEPDHRHGVDGMGHPQDHGAERLGVDQGPVRGVGIGRLPGPARAQDQELRDAVRDA